MLFVIVRVLELIFILQWLGKSQRIYSILDRLLHFINDFIFSPSEINKIKKIHIGVKGLKTNLTPDFNTCFDF